jgi:hypothetical protein
LASRKKNYRRRNPNSGYDNNQHNYSGSSRGRNTSNRDNHYFCDICGFTVPQSGSVSPMCTRCMVPMTVLRSSNLNRSKNDKKTSFDYSSRIYFQTDGHPQYKGLPLDHPDPEDQEAVNAYKTRIQSKRKRTGKPAGRDYKSQNRKPAQHHSRPQSGSDEKHPKKPVSRKPQNAIKSPGKTSENSGNQDKQSATKPEKKPAKPDNKMSRTASKKRSDEHTMSDKDVKPIREDDYAGTALTTDRSAATILSDTMLINSADSQGDLKTDYGYENEMRSSPQKTVRKPKQSKPSAKTSD